MRPVPGAPSSNTCLSCWNPGLGAPAVWEVRLSSDACGRQLWRRRGSSALTTGHCDKGRPTARSFELERRRVVDLLPDRQAETVAPWLRSRPGVEVVARDRWSEYARGIAAAVPDRWHLLHNVRHMLQRWLYGMHARLGRLPAVGEIAHHSVAKRTRAYRARRPNVPPAQQARRAWRGVYQEVRRHGQGEPCWPSAARRVPRFRLHEIRARA